MPKPNREVPEHIWWCFDCNGGVGCWGVGPPPRCPDCHGTDIAQVKFVPEPSTRRLSTRTLGRIYAGAVRFGWSDDNLAKLRETLMEESPMKNVTLADFLTDEQIQLAIRIGPDHARLLAEVVQPNMEQINRRLGQENDPSYMAYAIEYVLRQAGRSS